MAAPPPPPSPPIPFSHPAEYPVNEKTAEDHDDWAAFDGFDSPRTLSTKMQAFIGSPTGSRREVVRRLWEYIKQHDLVNPTNKREILNNDALKELFGCERMTMFQMNQIFVGHIGESVVPMTGDFSIQMTISAKLATFIGSSTSSRLEIITHVWEYIRKHDLYRDGTIHADERLKDLFGCETMTRFEMNHLLVTHIGESVEMATHRASGKHANFVV